MKCLKCNSKMKFERRELVKDIKHIESWFIKIYDIYWCETCQQHYQIEKKFTDTEKIYSLKYW